ncbi:hypothetical protein COY07_01770 [Candidatus Peregrinibacteria bacterium CG_4_10_14_0_2_um_filter_43_11]|nr:MAG: hypothetical protein COY07_01770 [Candidatus Peregrinibacteria bacterium CG_4_10_14_0_2_um_filter_43_11]
MPEKTIQITLPNAHMVAGGPRTYAEAVAFHENLGEHDNLCVSHVAVTRAAKQREGAKSAYGFTLNYRHIVQVLLGTGGRLCDDLERGKKVTEPTVAWQNKDHDESSKNYQEVTGVLTIVLPNSSEVRELVARYTELICLTLGGEITFPEDAQDVALMKDSPQ